MDIQSAESHPLFAEYCDLLIQKQNRTRQQEIRYLTEYRAGLLDGLRLVTTPGENPIERSECAADVLSNIGRQIWELDRPFVLPMEDSLRISFILWLRRIGEIDDESIDVVQPPLDTDGQSVRDECNVRDNGETQSPWALGAIAADMLSLAKPTLPGGFTVNKTKAPLKE